MNVKAVLLDIQGVLLQDGEPVGGAADAVHWLRDSATPVHFLTNVTTKPRRTIAEKMREAGIGVDDREVFSPPMAAGAALRQRNCQSIHLAADPVLAEDFTSFTLTDEDPDAVVLGDLYREFDWERLDRLFAMLRKGAVLVALHKNRYCRRGAEIALDLGPFVAALEYASDRPAVVVGKPAADFFQMALQDLGVAPGDALMVGDDLEADIGGAQGAGIRAVQVRTGKYRNEDEEHAAVRPDHRVDSIADLPALLGA